MKFFISAIDANKIVDFGKYFINKSVNNYDKIFCEFISDSTVACVALNGISACKFFVDVDIIEKENKVNKFIMLPHVRHFNKKHGQVEVEIIGTQTIYRTTNGRMYGYSLDTDIIALPHEIAKMLDNTLDKAINSDNYNWEYLDSNLLSSCIVPFTDKSLDSHHAWIGVSKNQTDAIIIKSEYAIGSTGPAKAIILPCIPRNAEGFKL